MQGPLQHDVELAGDRQFANIARQVLAAESNRTYGFRSVARDRAGNEEDKPIQIEASVLVPDLDPPVTEVVSVDVQSPSFQIAMRGSETGGAGLREFALFGQIDQGSIVELARLSAGSPDSNGQYSLVTSFQ